MDISKIIRERREAKRLTQLDMADKLQTERSNYARLESRGDKLTIEQLKSIAGALGVGVGELLGEGAKVENNEDFEWFEGRIKELEDRVKDKERIIEAKDEKFKTVVKNLEEKMYNDVNYVANIQGFTINSYFLKGSSGKQVYPNKKFEIDVHNEYNEESNDDILLIMREYNTTYENIAIKYRYKEGMKKKAVNWFFYHHYSYYLYTDLYDFCFNNGLIEDELLVKGFKKINYVYENYDFKVINTNDPFFESHIKSVITFEEFEALEVKELFRK